MMKLAIVLTATGTLLTLNLQLAWLEVEKSPGERILTGKLALEEQKYAERPPKTDFLLLRELPCEEIDKSSGTKVLLMPADAKSGFTDSICYEDIPKSAIKATESLWEITLPSDFDLSNTILRLHIDSKGDNFPTSVSSPCISPCISPRRLNSPDNTEDSDPCEDPDSQSSCKSIELPTWVSVLLTLGLCLG